MTIRVCAFDGCSASLEGKRADAVFCSRPCKEKARHQATGRARGRRYYHQNREACRARTREQYARNPEMFKKATKRWREANPEKNKEYCQRWLASDRGRTHLSLSRAITRCFNPQDKEHKNYGGRGITVHPRYLGDCGLDNLIADIGYRPQGLTLERLNVNGDYAPGNVRWATTAEQARNTRANRILTFAGKSLCVAAWAEEIGVSQQALYQRLHRGWPVEKVLTYKGRRAA